VRAAAALMPLPTLILLTQKGPSKRLSGATRLVLNKLPAGAACTTPFSGHGQSSRGPFLALGVDALRLRIALGIITVAYAGSMSVGDSWVYRDFL
jgi:hypothetical protein